MFIYCETLIVRVFYNLPDSLFAYTTILPPQDVFVHRAPDQSRKRRRLGSQPRAAVVDDEGDASSVKGAGEGEKGEEEFLGSVTLRGVLKGICQARLVSSRKQARGYRSRDLDSLMQ